MGVITGEYGIRLLHVTLLVGVCQLTDVRDHEMAGVGGTTHEKRNNNKSFSNENLQISRRSRAHACLDYSMHVLGCIMHFDSQSHDRVLKTSSHTPLSASFTRLIIPFLNLLLFSYYTSFHTLTIN